MPTYVLLSALFFVDVVLSALSLAPKGGRLQVVSYAVACERELASHCSGVNAFVEPPGSCPDHNDDFPPPSISFFEEGPGHLGCISRSLRFGRMLWCLARQPSVGVVLELFAGTGGGSTLLLSHGLSSHSGSLFTFEEDAGNVGHAIEVLQSFGISDLGYLRWDDVSPLTQVGQRPGTWLLLGKLSNGSIFVPLHTLCTAARGVDLVVLDPNHGVGFSELWPELEKACRPKFVAIHNANLPGHAGWVREYLLARRTSPLWHEVLDGSHPSIWEEGVRTWSLLAQLIESEVNTSTSSVG